MLRRYKNISSHCVLFSAIGFWFVFFLASPNLARASALGDLAASMKPGTWAQLATNNIVTALTSADWGGGATNQILYYSDDLVWDPNSRQAFFSGGDHNWNIPTTVKFVKYVESSNSWVEIGIPPWAGGVMHGYDHSAIDPGNRLFYHRPYSRQQVQRYNIDTQTWGQALPIPSFGDFYGESCCDAMEYFPELNGLVWVNGGGGVYLYSNATNQWTRLATGLSLGGTWHLAEYNPVHKVMIFYSAQTGALYKISSTGAVTRLNNPPVSLYNGSNGLLTVDPVSGDYIALTGSSLQPYKYDVLTDSWQVLSAASQPSFSGDGVVATPINTYGVIFFATCASSCAVYLYKHAAGTSSPPPTPAPTVSISASPASVISGSASTLTWSSTNASSCTASGGWSGTKAVSGSQATGALTANTTYTLTCTGSGGSANQSTSVTVTSSSSPPPSGSTDFQARCSAPGVVTCVGFDAQADIAGTYGDNHGTLPGNSAPSLDATVKASGNSSIKFTIPSNSGANAAGSYFTNFSDNLSTQFGPNSEFYIQWRQRFSPEFLSTFYQGGDGWKQTIIGTGDKPGCSSSTSTSGLCYSSCSALETVTQNTSQRGFAQLYNSCTGSTSHGPYDPFQEPFGSFDFKLQNARSAPYCLYSQSGSNRFPPNGNCLGYFANEWMTFQVRIKTGTRVNDEFTNSFVQLWIAREGQPSELVFDWGPYNLSAGSASENQRFGKIWLLPYNTGKSSSQSHPTAYTWYDELIISTTKIPDPSSAPPASQPPAAPTALTVK